MFQTTNQNILYILGKLDSQLQLAPHFIGNINAYSLTIALNHNLTPDNWRFPKLWIFQTYWGTPMTQETPFATVVVQSEVATKSRYPIPSPWFLGMCLMGTGFSSRFSKGWHLPSGNFLQFANWKMAQSKQYEIVDLPKMVDLSIVMWLLTRGYTSQAASSSLPSFISKARVERPGR